MLRTYNQDDKYSSIHTMQYDHTLNITRNSHLTLGYIEGKEKIMIKDIGNDDSLIVSVDSEKRLLMIITHKLLQANSKTFIASKCTIKQTIASLTYNDKLKKAFIVTNCMNQYKTTEQRVFILTRKDFYMANLQSEYSINIFTVNQDFAYVRDILISNEFDNIMWAGTIPKSISFLVSTPLTNIASSSFLNTTVSFVVEETTMYPLMNPDFIEFKKLQRYSSWSLDVKVNDIIEVTYKNLSYSR